MTSTDVALDFWLRYVEASGGLTEFGGDTTLVMLPPALQTVLELAERPSPLGRRSGLMKRRGGRLPGTPVMGGKRQ